MSAIDLSQRKVYVKNAALAKNLNRNKTQLQLVRGDGEESSKLRNVSQEKSNYVSLVDRAGQVSLVRPDRVKSRRQVVLAAVPVEHEMRAVKYLQPAKTKQENFTTAIDFAPFMKFLQFVFALIAMFLVFSIGIWFAADVLPIQSVADSGDGVVSVAFVQHL